MHNKSFEGHNLRISVCGKRFKTQHKKEKDADANANAGGAGAQAETGEGSALKKAKGYDYEVEAPKAFEGKRASKAPTG